MNPIVAHLVSGRVLWSALPLVAVGVLRGDRITNPSVKRLATVMVWNLSVLGLSTAALPIWGMALFGISLGTWTFRDRLFGQRTWRRMAIVCPVVLACGILVSEATWMFPRPISTGAVRSVIVLGDSLSAGIGEREGPIWPDQLRDSFRIPVQNLSEAGATTQDGCRRVELVNHFPGVVVVELGGNDLLGGRSLSEFSLDLEKILEDLHSHQREVVLVELPLLPGKNSWGVEQRRLARKYNCTLFPKRFLVDVLAAPGSTIDTLHLTHTGHKRLAEKMQEVLSAGLSTR